MFQWYCALLMMLVSSARPQGGKVTGWGQERTSILGMKKMSRLRPAFLKPTLLEEGQPPTCTPVSPSFPHRTSSTELATATEGTAPTTTGSPEDYKTTYFSQKISSLHPALLSVVTNAFEPTPTKDFSAEVVNRERGQRSKCTLSIYRGGSKHTRCCCFQPTSLFLPQLPTCCSVQSSVCFR